MSNPHKPLRRTALEQHARQFPRIVLLLFTASGIAGLTFESSGVAYARQGDSQRAKGAWDEALRMDPAHAAARRNREQVEQALTRGGSTRTVSPFLD